MAAYLIICIAHGGSEVELIKGLARRMNIKVSFPRWNDGCETVSMKNIAGLMRDGFASMRDLKRQVDLKGVRLTENDMDIVTILPVLDVDSDGISFKSYRSGDMFSQTCFAEAIVPIYNNPCLEDVLIRAGYEVRHERAFYTDFASALDIRAFRDRLHECEGTNMDLMIDIMMSHAPNYQ